jgi:hypothetical protein
MPKIPPTAYGLRPSERLPSTFRKKENNVLNIFCGLMVHLTCNLSVLASQTEGQTNPSGRQKNPFYLSINRLLCDIITLLSLLTFFSYQQTPKLSTGAPKSLRIIAGNGRVLKWKWSLPNRSLLTP